MLRWKTVAGIATATPGHRQHPSRFCAGSNCYTQVDVGWKIEVGGKKRPGAYCGGKCIREEAENDHKEIGDEALRAARVAEVTAYLEAKREALAMAEQRAALALGIAATLDRLPATEALTVLDQVERLLEIRA